MTVTHDAYLFSPERFRDRIVHNVLQGRDWRVSYEGLRDLGISAFRASAAVRLLADRYGGWDENEIMAQLPAGHNGNEEDRAFWLMLLLYDSLTPIALEKGHLGLDAKWREVEDALMTLRWPALDVSAFVRGHRFLALFDQELGAASTAATTVEDARVALSLMRPASTASSVGWLSFNDVVSIVWRVRAALSGPGNSGTLDLERLARMLSVAAQHRSGLCLIISG